VCNKYEYLTTEICICYVHHTFAVVSCHVYV